MAFRDTWDFFGAGNQMAADQLGAFPMEQWYVNVLAGSSPDAPLVFAPFTDREGNPISYATGNAWAIPTGAANPEAACEFMKAVTSVDAWTAAAQARADMRAEAGTINTGVYSGNLLADEIVFGEIVQPSGNEAFDTAVQTILEVSDNAFIIPPNPAANEFKQAWMDAANRVLNGEQTAQEALDQAQAEAQAALDDAWSRQD
jgi:multiple sugar transport system substrate-binding protein